ncbi:MAG: DUF2490 domain-containing protein [Bacteroidota bacterium]
MRTILCLVIAFIFSLNTSAQNLTPPTDNGYWIGYFGDNKISEKFGIHTEVQLRSLFLEDGLSTQLYRTGINYYLPEGLMLTLGYAYIYNKPDGIDIDAVKSEEQRVWQQFIVRTKKTILSMEHRYRLEQRFIRNLETKNQTTKYRARYRYQIIHPLASYFSAFEDIFAVANNEIMLNLDSKPNQVFDRNRLFLGLGYKFSPEFNVQMGYMNQYARLSSGNSFTDHIVQFNLFYNFNLATNFFNEPS